MVILPAALKPVHTQGQENTLKPFPGTRPSCELLVVKSSASIFQTALPRDPRLKQSSLSCNLSQCLLMRDPMEGKTMVAWSSATLGNQPALQDGHCSSLSRCLPLPAHADLSDSCLWKALETKHPANKNHLENLPPVFIKVIQRMERN